MSWQIIRPDAVFALEEELINKYCKDYVRIAKRELPARFQIAKRIAANEVSWKEHERCLKVFEKIKAKIFSKKISLDDLEIPEFSFLDLKIELAKRIFEACEFCEWHCRVNRKKQAGVCGAKELEISSEFIHLGEERHITPSHTIFFMGCNMKCIFCQNWTISFWQEKGWKIKPEQLAKIIDGKSSISRNINLVGGEPTPHLLGILQTLKLVNSSLPVIWNSNMYMSEQAMQLLHGIVDMYLADFKYGNNACAKKFSLVSNYFEIVARNHKIAEQQADLTIRHLILPNHVECCTKPIFSWLSKNLKRYLLNVMSQYTPYWKAWEREEISRPISKEEYEKALSIAKKLKLPILQE